MNAPQNNQELNVTASVLVTEQKGTFLGIDGLGILYVFATFTFVNIFLSNFLLGCAAALILYFILRLYLTGKPRHFLFYSLLYPFRPKVYRHQCQAKKLILLD